MRGERVWRRRGSTLPAPAHLCRRALCCADDCLVGVGPFAPPEKVSGVTDGAGLGCSSAGGGAAEDASQLSALVVAVVAVAVKVVGGGGGGAAAVGG